MPQFAVLIYVDDSAHAHDAPAGSLAENDQHAHDLAQTGTMKLAYALTPRAEAVSIRATGTTSGPFLNTAQVVAGFYVLDAEDIDTAITIAGTNPAVYSSSGGVEIRPVHSGGII